MMNLLVCSLVCHLPPLYPVSSMTLSVSIPTVLGPKEDSGTQWVLEKIGIGPLLGPTLVPPLPDHTLLPTNTLMT